MYPIADMLVRIKNAQMTGARQVEIPFSKTKFSIANILYGEGYLEQVERRTKKNPKSEHEYLVLGLRYGDDKSSAITDIRIVSRPSRHLYTKVAEIRQVRSGHGLAVLSTSKGIMTAHEAKKQNLGGEVLFEIW